MKNVIMLISAIVVGSVVIQQIISATSKKHIASREDDPTIPQISGKAF